MNDKPENSALPEDTHEGERVAKVLARAGICSRRDAERLIGEGRVALDGVVLTSPAVNVTPEQSLTVDGVIVGAPEPRACGAITSPRAWW